MRRNRTRELRYVLAIATLVVGAVALYYLSPILTPFLFGAILAYIFDPVVDRLERWRVPRTLGTLFAVILLITALALLVVILIPLFYKEAQALAERLPLLVGRAQNELIPWLNARFGLTLSLDAASIKAALTEALQQTEGAAGKLLASLRIGGLAILGFLVNVALIPVVMFYLLRDWDVLVARLETFIPRRWHEEVTSVVKEIDTVLSEFLRGQLSVMLIMSVFYTTGLWLTGLDFALPIGIITGMLVFVPYLGSISGFVLGSLAALMQFDSFWPVVGVWAVFGIGQLLEGFVVTPWLVGDRVGLHPVAVIFALLAFGQVFGFTGVLLALPASAALLVWMRHFLQKYRRSSVYRH